LTHLKFFSNHNNGIHVNHTTHKKSSLENHRINNCLDNETNEIIAKGSVAWLRRGHRGGCYLKGEQLTFYRDVFAPDELLKLITTAK
jgi:hypothetical protein